MGPETCATAQIPTAGKKGRMWLREMARRWGANLCSGYWGTEAVMNTIRFSSTVFSDSSPRKTLVSKTERSFHYFF